MTNSLVNQYLTRVSHFAGEYVMLIYLREGAENIDGHSGMMLQSIGCWTSGGTVGLKSQLHFTDI